MDHIVYLGLGTNLGNRIENLKGAVAAMSPLVKVLKKSSIYETPPWGFKAQGKFLNQVILAQTDLEAHALLGYLKQVESDLGRVPNFQNGPRLIDIDILFFDKLVISTPSLIIPHLHLHERAFVLVPLHEIAPDLVHPVLGESVAKLLERVRQDDIMVFEQVGFQPV